MIGKLWLYFGVIGILSILAWLAALVLFSGWVRSKQRTKFYWIALGLAVAGLLFAKINSHFVSAIEPDRSEEHAKALERQKELRRQLEEEQSKKAAKVRYVEDNASDALDLAGIQMSKTGDVYETAATAEDPDAKYAYRRRGKQERAVSAIAATNAPVIGESAPTVKAREARLLPERDVVNANRFDRINLFLARFSFWLACLLVAWDYLARFNRTLDHLWPLPISHRQLDELWPKTYSVWLRGTDMRTYLANVVRKRENFLYFGPADPIADAALPRLAWRRWKFWLLRKLDVAGYDDELVFESAWFHRYAVVVVGRSEAERRLAGLVTFLEQRHRTRAWTRRTVHVVWDFDTAPSETVLTKIGELCREANYKVVVTAPSAPPVFEEVCAAA